MSLTPQLFWEILWHDVSRMTVSLLEQSMDSKTRLPMSMPSNVMFQFNHFLRVSFVDSNLYLFTNLRAALQVAEVMLVDKVGILRLNNVWGVGGGAQPVKALSRRIFMLLKEFLSSNDTVEAGRCLRELEVPHFHHELVYEASLCLNSTTFVSVKSNS